MDCEHVWQLGSTIPFSEMQYEFAVLPPPGKKYKDEIMCNKCGSIQKFIWDDNPNWKEDNPYWKEDYPNYKDENDS